MIKVENQAISYFTIALISKITIVSRNGRGFKNLFGDFLDIGDFVLDFYLFLDFFLIIDFN